MIEAQMQDRRETWQNAAAFATGDGAEFVLSICVPFYNFDVTSLADRLIRQSQPFGHSLEILFADDGSMNSDHIERLKQRLSAADLPVRLYLFTCNQGRSKIRNVLASKSRGGYLVFLDCDMYPDSDRFVAEYFRLAKAGSEDIVVGGCTYNQLTNIPASQYLYYYHSNRTQCVSLKRRLESPLRYVFTNNLMFKRDLLSSLSFDSGYVGWGYEDTDWAIGYARIGGRILHIDNTATHFGLIDDDSLINKYRASAPNFLRLAKKFPTEVAEFPIYKAVRAVSRIPLPFETLSCVLERLIRQSALPLRLRYIFLQCFKVALYADLMRHGRSKSAEARWSNVA